MGADAEESGSYVRDRIYELPDDIETEVLEAVEEFTVPCKLCVPGAREMGRLVPFDFVVEGREEDKLYEDEEYLPDDEDGAA